MSTVVMGLFDTRIKADNVVRSLQSFGYDGKEISFITKDNVNDAGNKAEATAGNAAEGATGGAVTGGLIGGLAGLLAGIGALTIPGVGPFLVGGPIAAALGLTGAAATTATGAITGALGGGIVGALLKLGIPEEEVAAYEQSLSRGGVLIAAPTSKKSEKEVVDLMRNNGGESIKAVTF